MRTILESDLQRIETNTNKAIELTKKIVDSYDMSPIGGNVTKFKDLVFKAVIAQIKGVK